MTVDVLLVGGGTAGHVLPALATARALGQLDPSLQIAFAGRPGSLEERLVVAAGHRIHHVDAVALPRRISLDLFRVAPRLNRALRRARDLLSEQSVRLVVSFGGYVALPVSLAARGRIPLLLHEQNSRPGLANRIASRYADVVAVTFAESSAGFSSGTQVHVTGNPVQEHLRELDRVERRLGARARLGLDGQRGTLLVFGGSQGAASINDGLAGAAAAWRALGLQIVHVTGHGGHDAALAAWQAGGVDPAAEGSSVRIVPFLDDMADAYAAADIVVARAGATTIAELAVLGLPSVLVPYPHATADHQRGNAAALVAAGAAVLLDDADLTPTSLVDAVTSIMQDAGRMGRMSLAARSWARPHAAEALARLAMGLLPAPHERWAGRGPDGSGGAEHVDD